MHQRALARAARSHHREHLAGVNFEINVAQNLASFLAFGTAPRLIREADFLKPDAARKRRQRLRSGLLFYIVLCIHELEYLGRRSQRLLKIVIKQRELAHRIVQLENRNDKRQKRAGGEYVAIDLLPSQQKKQRNRNRPKNVHKWRTDR